uniref:Putative glycosyl hydrolase family5 n=1 Tax=uncultured symbiotic protist of Hodotermopsis sjoestedti TaxID=403659 RepID=A4UWS3_9EUKA|nr:putative glycosyl hydrolase family5 [uncultured symbiotic protist of Hodotermopsis sjoestedti]
MSLVIFFTLLKIAFSADADLPNDAPKLAAKLGFGWNLGNALESCSDSNSASETSWGNPATTQALIDAVKKAGFNTVRIPSAWSGYIENTTTYKIKDSWLKRVSEVVNYTIKNDMYAILNIHWDGGWLEENPTFDKQKEVNAKQKALWTQIATYFEGYDEHLLFAGTNEVRKDYGTPSDENIEVQNSYLQTFVDAVRATGGNNKIRNLVVQGYNTNIEHTVNYLRIPSDNATHRLLVEIHFYDPYDFAGEGNSQNYLWGKSYANSGHVSSWGQESWVDEAFGMLKKNFVDKQYPVILGEYGAVHRTHLSGDDLVQHTAARKYYLNYVTQAALTNGVVPYYWDNGGTGDNGFGLIDRNNYSQAFPDDIKAITSAKR